MISIVTSCLPMGFVGDAYRAALEAEVYLSRTVVWTAEDESVPPGLSLSANGVLSGVPIRSYRGSIEVCAACEDPEETARTVLSLRIYGALSLKALSLPDGQAGQAYSAPLVAEGGAGPCHWMADSLPLGLQLSGAWLTGTPQVSGGFAPITFTVVDAEGHSAEKCVFLRIL
ncbi:putative Ig domain-containing protein [Oscillibacter sp.]|uniref:putative Ig domain-containing protein n=1 Tax=Oscillibacter sp. TaxID=1945593 RepID=UPI00289E3002|nr:putative Ig domain-containing protein [Oscillibacter sp.]